MKHCLLKVAFTTRGDFRLMRDTVRSFLRTVAGEQKFGLIEVAVNEAVNNALEHSGSNRAKHLKMRVLGNKKLVIRVSHHGAGLPLVEHEEECNFPAFNDERLIASESGRGIAIMRAVTDLIKYNKKGTEVLLVKKL